MLVINISSADNGKSFTASCDSLSIRKTAKDPIGPLCRKLIERGHSPQARVLVCRDTFPVFHPRTLAAWAKHDIVDDDNRGLRRVRYRPRPDFQGDGDGAPMVNAGGTAVAA